MPCGKASACVWCVSSPLKPAWNTPTPPHNSDTSILSSFLAPPPTTPFSYPGPSTSPVMPRSFPPEVVRDSHHSHCFHESIVISVTVTVSAVSVSCIGRLSLARFVGISLWCPHPYPPHMTHQARKPASQPAEVTDLTGKRALDRPRLDHITATLGEARSSTIFLSAFISSQHNARSS